MTSSESPKCASDFSSLAFPYPFAQCHSVGVMEWEAWSQVDEDVRNTKNVVSQMPKEDVF